MTAFLFGLRAHRDPLWTVCLTFSWYIVRDGCPAFASEAHVSGSRGEACGKEPP